MVLRVMYIFLDEAQFVIFIMYKRRKKLQSFKNRQILQSCDSPYISIIFATTL